MTIWDKLELFAGQLECSPAVYTWLYDGAGRLIQSNCPNESVMADAFRRFGCKENMYRFEQDLPLLLGAPVGMQWIAERVPLSDAAQPDSELGWVVLGPVFSTEISLKSVEEILRGLSHNTQLELSINAQMELLRAMEQVPVCMPVLLTQYALMLHYVLTGEYIRSADLHYSDIPEIDFRDGTLQKKDRHRVWMYEQGLMRMVREGDLNFKAAFVNSSGISNGVPVQSKDPLRQAKTSIIVFISLCVRAAIEGGLSPETAYSLGDSYIQSVENATTPIEASAISPLMYEDFVRRVHACRVNPKLSKPIQICCDYIEENVEDKPNVDEIAKRVGYSAYYLTRKFKEEMGVSLNNYIKMVKIERAKYLLVSTEDSLQQIADRLDFCSRSYFGEAFRQIVGCAPLEYREQHGKR